MAIVCSLGVGIGAVVVGQSFYVADTAVGGIAEPKPCLVGRGLG